MDTSEIAQNKSAIVLAVPHRLQGPGFEAFIKDPAYCKLLRRLIGSVDFVFEEAAGLGEAAGCGPSIAEELAKSLLEPGRYLDIDPPKDQRTKHGLAEATGGVEAIDTDQVENGQIPDEYRWEIVDEHRKREELWIQRVVEQSFTKGLVICGSAHGLSVAFRLQCASLSVSKVYYYTPYEKLCPRPHSD
jgi:hypothetical protein